MTNRDAKLLTTVHPLLASLFVDVAKRHSIGVARGAGTLADEQRALATGHSWLKDPSHSQHIPGPDGFAHALDFFVRNSDGSANWSLDAYEAPVEDFKETARIRGFSITCGWDWHQRDAGHIEIHLPMTNLVST